MVEKKNGEIKEELREEVDVLKIPKDEIPELMLNSMEEYIKVMERNFEEDEDGETEKVVEKIKTVNYSPDTVGQIFQNARMLFGDFKEFVELTTNYELKKFELEKEMEKILKEAEVKITHIKECTETARIQITIMKEIAIKLIDWVMNQKFSEDEQADFERKMEIIDRANNLINRSISLIEKMITN